MKNYRDLDVWTSAVELAATTTKIVDSLAPNLRKSLGDQMIRAAISIPANIAEGQGRHSPADFRRHLRIARGSHAELMTYFEILARLEHPLGKRTGVLALANETGRMLNALIRAIKVPDPVKKAGPLTPTTNN